MRPRVLGRSLLVGAGVEKSAESDTLHTACEKSQEKEKRQMTKKQVRRPQCSCLAYDPYICIFWSNFTFLLIEYSVKIHEKFDFEHILTKNLHITVKLEEFTNSDNSNK